VAGKFEIGIAVQSMNRSLERSTERRSGARSPIAANECDFRRGARWYAVHTLPRREFGARAQLEAQSYTIYLPCHLRTVRHARKLKTINAPFFPRYLFVRLDLSRDRWRSINGTFGVAGIIMEGEQPMPVALGIVEALQAGLDSDSEAARNGDLQTGQQVEVMVGPFASLVGKLESFDGRARVRILLQIMGANTPVSLNRGAVVPISG
jgi:transcription elongation factor/antiterminator RfaH